MPKRMIRDWTDSERVNSLTPQAERFYARLLMKADDFGRFHAAPKLLRGSLFPLLIDSVREADISRWIAECEKAGLIVLYEADGKKLLEIWNFGQRLDKARAKFPPPPKIVQDSPGISGKVRAEEESESESEKEVELEREAEGVQASEADVATQEQEVVLRFPVVVEGDGPSEWLLRQYKITEYRETYPGIDPLQESRKALQWIRDNPSNRKTYRGMTKFLNGWMSRAQDRAPALKTHSGHGPDLLSGLRGSREKRLGYDG